MKYQEISPPLVDDFLYICDDTYIRDEMLAMERSLLKTLGFDLGIPLSYSFLRRYAQVCNAMFHTVIFIFSEMLPHASRRYVVSFWATACKTIRPMPSVRCHLSCLSVCLSGQTVGRIKASALATLC